MTAVDLRSMAEIPFPPAPHDSNSRSRITVMDEKQRLDKEKDRLDKEKDRLDAKEKRLLNKKVPKSDPEWTSLTEQYKALAADKQALVEDKAAWRQQLGGQAGQPAGPSSAEDMSIQQLAAELKAGQQELEQKLAASQQELKSGQQELAARLERLEASQSSLPSSSSRASINKEDRDRKDLVKAAGSLYGCPLETRPDKTKWKYCHATGKWWPIATEVVTCSHIIQRRWCRDQPDHYSNAGLVGEWDPRGTLFFIKTFEEAFDKGAVCLIWSGQSTPIEQGSKIQPDEYKIKLLDMRYHDKVLTSSPSSEAVTFGQVDGRQIAFLTDARPNKRAVNLHARWAFKRFTGSVGSGVGSDTSAPILPESVWSGGSWKQRVETWLETFVGENK